VFLECQPREAEFIKHVSYAFLATKLSLANEVALLASQLEIGYDIVRQALAADRRIGPEFLGVGLGFGGSSFPKDLASLIETARAVDRPLTVLEAVLSTNRHQVDRICSQIETMLGELTGKNILQLGLTYKAGTDDVRGSPAVELAFSLVHQGAKLVCHDPVYEGPTVGSDQIFAKVADPVTAAAVMDLIVLATDWPEYRNLPWAYIASKMSTPRILDGRNMLDPQAMREAGFEYRGVGR
jgi:UDPglucose 6-dehydrogenase